MKRSLTPKQVARAIGVSESSLKRWCDRGLLPVTKTAGGHRRLSVDSVMKFLRQERYKLVEPEVLGLPPSTGSGTLVIERARQKLLDAMIQGDEESLSRIVFDLFLGNISLVQICDDVLAGAFQEVGALWECNSLDVYQERRACELCARILQQLSLAIGQPGQDRPLALGCTPSGDQYTLATRMAELVFRSENWRATSLGCCLPFSSIRVAIGDLKPAAFWLSVSHLEDEAAFADRYEEFFDVVKTQTQVFLGGRALTGALRDRLPAHCYCRNMADLQQRLAEWSESESQRQAAADGAAG